MIYLFLIPAVIASIILYGYLHNEIDCEEEEETHRPDTSITKRIKEKYDL